MSLAYAEAAPAELLDRELNDTLRMEMGWDDVANGLGRILFGYGIWIGGFVLGLMVLGYPLVQLGSKIRPNALSIGHLWCFYAGAGIISVASLIAQMMILAGQWKCVLNAPERRWARWWMFICLVSLAMGPALSIGSQLGGVRTAPELARGVGGLAVIRFTTAGMVMQISSFSLGILYVISFTLFLQAAAQSMESRVQVMIVNLFLAFFVPLAVVTGYLSVKLTMDPSLITKLIKPLLFVGLGWMISMPAWLFIMLLIRSCIKSTMARVRSPMEYSQYEPQQQQQHQVQVKKSRWER